MSELPRTTPESAGLRSTAVLAFLDRLEREGIELHSLMLLRHGQVLAEGWWTPYHRDGVQLVYSLSKSFTSCAVALAVDEGLLGLDDRLVDLFAVDAGPRASTLTVHDVLSMNTGHHVDLLDVMRRADEPVATYLAHEPESDRDEFFVYDNGATFVAGAAAQRATGQRLLDYLRPRLLDPIGAGPAAWLSVPDGRDAGFSGLHLRTEAIARFGQLLLDDGRWEGRQVLPQGWVLRATSALTDNSRRPEEGDDVDWRQGYGYQFWRCRHGAYRGDGAYGQFCVVLPDRDAVVAITAVTEDMQGVLDAVWDVLLPAYDDGPVSEDPSGRVRLEERLRSAALPVIASTTAAGDGPWHFTHEPSEEHPLLSSVELHRDGPRWRLVIDDWEVVEAPCGDGSWPAVDGPFVATGGWTSPGVFEARVCAVETPHSLLLRCAGGRVTAHWVGHPLHGPVLGGLVAPREDLS